MNTTIEKIKKGVRSCELIDSALKILRKKFKENDFLFSHSLRVGLILKEMGGEEETIGGAILHHISGTSPLLKKLPQKNQKNIEEILKKLEKLNELCSLKKETKVKPLKIKKWQKVFLNQQAENLRKMFFAIIRDLRPIFITIGSVLDEMRNLNYFPEEEQIKKSQQVLEIFSPLAYGMGMGEIKGQLEDLAFPYLYPKEYNWLIENVKDKYTEREQYLEKVKWKLVKILAQAKIKPIDIHARAKHYFSLYQKLLRHSMDIEQIYDLVALRIIVSNVEDCYRVLGVIHKTWPPLKGRIKDYIASPKPNGYRSLHTTVFCEDGRITEFQIKTLRMHQEAEYGVAAHLRYKGKIPKRTYKHQFYWLDQLRKWKEEIRDPKKISEYLDSELFKDQIFVLTPKGDVINLPKDACPIDFAYAIHSEIGDHCEFAKVDGKIVPLNYTLKTGERVEIITDKNKTPSSDWLRFVKTPKARSKIKSFLEKAYGISPLKPKITTLGEKVSLIKKILPIKRKKVAEVLIGGERGISVKFSKCCSPKPGDKILGFVTKGEGASVHRIDCQNLKYLQEKWPQRIVKASWIFEKENG